MGYQIAHVDFWGPAHHIDELLYGKNSYAVYDSDCRAPSWGKDILGMLGYVGTSSTNGD